MSSEASVLGWLGNDCPTGTQSTSHPMPSLLGDVATWGFVWSRTRAERPWWSPLRWQWPDQGRVEDRLKWTGYRENMEVRLRMYANGQVIGRIWKLA